MAKQYYCFLERFNNYFNRKIIKYENLADYQSNSLDSFIPIDSQGAMTPFDFNPNDNVTTEIIANDVPFEPDYFLLLDEDQNIVQRWFCIEQKRNRQGQWLYQLKRDVIADNLDSLLNAPIFVQKGMLKEDDPFIVNDEGMSLNQIKRGEWFIKDRSKTAWIVGYLAKNAGGSDIQIQTDQEDLVFDYKTISEIASEMGTTEGVLNSFLNFGNDTTNKAYFTTSVSIKVDYLRHSQYWQTLRQYIDLNYDFSSLLNIKWGETYYADAMGGVKPYLFEVPNWNVDNNLLKTAFANACIEKKSLWMAQMSSILGRSYYLTENQLNILKSFNGTYIRYNGEYYRISVVEEATHETKTQSITKSGTYTALDYSADRAVELASAPRYNLVTGTYDASNPKEWVLEEIKSNEKTVIVSLKYLTASDFIPQLNTQISSGRKTTIDQECDIFAIPLNMVISNNGNDFETIEMHSRRIASAISLNQNAKVYDLQLLPYCPIPNLITNDNNIDITNLIEHEDYDFITKNISDIIESYIYKSDMTFTPAGDGVWNVTGSTTLSVPAGKTATVTSVDPHYFSSQGQVSDFSYSVVGG